MARKSTKRAAAAPASKAAASVTVGGNSFKGSIYHGGRMYDGKKKEDVVALAKLVDGKKIKSEQLQHLADKGKLHGFGTKAGKKAKAEDETEVSPEANAVAGGGVQAVEEPEEE